MAGFVLTFDVDGDTQVARGFSRFADNVKDLSDAFREIAKDFHESEERQFDTEGGYGAGGWAPLAPSTIESKARRGFPDRILVRTGQLRDSLMGRGPRAVEVVRPLELRVGTELDYARYHQRGTRRMPARPVIMLPEEQKTRMHKTIHRYLVKQANRSFTR